MLLERVRNLVRATPFALNQETEDSLAWAFSKDGLFSLQSAYLLARGSNPLNLGISSMSWIWKADTHPRIQFFMWMCSHNSLPTSEILGLRGLNLNPICTICHQENESVDHLLRRCNVAQDLWRKLKVPRELLFTFDQLVEKWLELNCSTGAVFDHLGISWKVVFPMGIWQLWLARNKFHFRTSVVDKLIHTKCIKESVEFFAIGAKDWCNKMKKVIRVAWMKLNSNGSALGNPSKAGGGGLIRDHQGNWVRGYARAHVNTSSSIAELWALRDGLEIAKDLGLNNLIVEMDALSIVLLMNNTKANLLMKPLLSNCRKLLAAIPNKRVVHTFHETN